MYDIRVSQFLVIVIKLLDLLYFHSQYLKEYFFFVTNFFSVSLQYFKKLNNSNDLQFKLEPYKLISTLQLASIIKYIVQNIYNI